MKYNEYKTIKRLNSADLDRDVNKLLQDGWELFGTPYVHDTFLVQAMVK